MSRPRLGFLGVGWIGRNRMEAMLATGAVEAVGIADSDPRAAAEAQALAPEARIVPSLDTLLALDPDGIVIATPNALHADQAIASLSSGAAVFCQKPLGRTEKEVASVLDAARTADRLLGVDLSYRFTEGAKRIRALVRSGQLGKLYAASLVFHNGYGPDKPWFYDPALSGGGCVMDLGVHLVDQALWMLDFPEVMDVTARLWRGGRPAEPGEVEDHAIVRLDLDGGMVVDIACSWCLHVGCDAIISTEYHGSSGGAAMRNVDGSFYDFLAEHYCGTAREVLARPPDPWGGGAACDWALKLAAGKRFADSSSGLRETARILDRIYRRGTDPATIALKASVAV